MITGRPTVDLTGQKFGMLTVLEKVKGERGAKWRCLCDCGSMTYVYSTDLRKNKIKSCGCYRYKFVSESKIKDLTNQRFGRLIVIEQANVGETGGAIWRCKCDCGNFRNVKSQNLIHGHTQSCGCLHKETFNRFTHHQSKTRLYRIYHAMKERCSRPGAINYQYYGAKGIRVCPEWNEFVPFKEWAMANGYADNLCIDRIDSTKDYSPSNCRWITQADNAREAVKVRERKRKSDRET